jgi:hypothetical protein
VRGVGGRVKVVKDQVLVPLRHFFIRESIVLRFIIISKVLAAMENHSGNT